MPELKCEGETSVCATLKAKALAPQPGQKRAPSGSSRPQLEQAVKGRLAMARRYKSRGAPLPVYLVCAGLKTKPSKELAEVLLLLLRLLVELVSPRGRQLVPVLGHLVLHLVDPHGPLLEGRLPALLHDGSDPSPVVVSPYRSHVPVPGGALFK